MPLNMKTFGKLVGYVQRCASMGSEVTEYDIERLLEACQEIEMPDNTSSVNCNLKTTVAYTAGLERD